MLIVVGGVMALERRSDLKLLSNQDLRGDTPVRDEVARALSGPVVTVSAAIALVVSGVVYGFFDWAPLWFHLIVFAATFALMLAYGRRLSEAE